MNTFDWIEKCASCNDLFSFDERYKETPDGWTCSIQCYLEYCQFIDLHDNDIEKGE